MPAMPVFDTLLGYQIRRLSLVVMADLAEALAPLGLRPAEASVLIAIHANAGLTQSELGRMLGIKRANMAPLIAGLESRAAVSRDAVDGRSQALHLTEDGKALHAQALAATRAHEERCFGAVSDVDRLRLCGALNQLWAGRAETIDEG